MSKRLAEDGDEAPTKRQKIEEKPQDVSVERIHSARQIQGLLTFQQDAVPQLRAGIKSFKTFLESILYPKESASTSAEQSLLKQFLDSHIQRKDSEAEATYLPSLIQAWSFAAQTNNENLLSAIPAIFALLLRTISPLIDFRDHGLAIGRTCLEQAPLQLLSRGLSSATHKERLISPCLRLLTEIVTFDGGTLAKRVYRSRAYTFDAKIISRNLTLWKAASKDKEVDRRKPSVRSNTVRYLWAHLKFQISAIKGEILKYSNILSALLRYAKQDPSDLLRDVFKVLKDVLQDPAVPRSAKSYAFVDHNLSAIAEIYRSESTTDDSLRKENDRLAHEFLLFICSDPSAGVLRHSSWYPPGTDRIENDGNAEIHSKSGPVDLGLDSIEWYDKYLSSVPTRNTALSNFAQTLRPYSNLLESEVLVTIFRSAPELVADYFYKKSGFSFDPKLTSTWIGYSAFLFSTVKLPVPPFFGREDGYWNVPPPTALILENILPHPLSQKILTKCFNQNQDMIVFFASRILILAFAKLDICITKFQEAAEEQGSLWREGLERLVTDFTTRCPKMKDVITAFQRCPTENTLQREALVRLIKLYYKALPQSAMVERFDIGVPLANAMRQLESHGHKNKQQNTSEAVNIQLVELNHLLQIALWMPDMKWWQKPENLKLSPFTMLLRLVGTIPNQRIPQDMRDLLHSVAMEYGIGQGDTSIPSSNALIASIMPSEAWVPSTGLFEFLDEVFGRLVRKPIKYQDDLDILRTGDNGDIPTSLAVVAATEQWPFFSSKPDSDNINEWLSRITSVLKLIGEDDKTLAKLRTSIAEVDPKHCKDIEQQDRSREAELRSNLESLSKSAPSSIRQDSVPDTIAASPPTVNAESFAPELEDPKHTALHRWSKKTLPEAINDGDVSDLILCLSSVYSEVRKLALRNLQQVMHALEPPAVSNTFPPSRQIWLLLGILTNTVAPLFESTKHDTDDETVLVPYLLSRYASTAVLILTNPMHPMYTKIARFHTKSPTFSVSHLPSYWMDQLLRSPPTDTAFSQPAKSTRQIDSSSTNHDDPLQARIYPNVRHTELAFLLSYLYSSVRSSEDLSILRKRGTFEPLLALASDDVYLPADIREMVLRLLWRVTAIEGGSTTFITRFGGVTWLSGMISNARHESRNVAGGSGGRKLNGRHGEVNLDSKESLKQLVQRVWETCDQEHVDQWSGGMMASTIEQILRA